MSRRLSESSSVEDSSTINDIDVNEEEKVSEIIGFRRADYSDLEKINQLVRTKTFDMFGNADVGKIFEKSCLSVVQINEEREIVSNVSLCNFPNVPSVPTCDWLFWIVRHYGVPGLSESNTFFIHFLVWDVRYEEIFLKLMLRAVYSMIFHCYHVIMVVPPGTSPDVLEIFEKCMKKFSPLDKDSDLVQIVFVSSRQQEDPKLKIRRAVEEDNDDLIPIIDEVSKALMEFYGDYYISEIMRYPDNENRQLIVAECEGRATGVACLNKSFDIDVLTENFELLPYNDLRKFVTIVTPCSTSISSTESSSSSDYMKTASEVFDAVTPKDRDRVRFSLAIAHTLHYEDENEGEYENIPEPISKSTKVTERRSIISSTMNFESVLRMSVYADAISELPLANLGRPSDYNDGDDDDDLPISQAGSEKSDRRDHLQLSDNESNAFALELFSMSKDIDERHARDYLEASYECFPDLDYCFLMLPPTQPYFALLDHFVRVPLRYDRDFPMTLYVTHRVAVLNGVKSREAIPYDREIIVNFLQKISRRKLIIDDFDEAIDNPNGNKQCFVFLSEEEIIGLAIIQSEYYIEELAFEYNIEDFVSMKNTSRDDHAELLHFVVVPIFSIYNRQLLCDLMRLSCTSVLYYRLYNKDTTAVSRTRPLITCFDALIPVKSRTRCYHPYPENENNLDSDSEDFGLFLTTPRLTTMERRVVNSKIVVIGASDCGVSFAEYLSFHNSTTNIVQFTNITIVSPNGIPFEGKGGTEHATMIPFRGRFCYEYRKVVPSRVWINIVDGIISHINRKEKYVVVSGVGTLNYDYLVLTCGLQYQIPKFHGNRRTDENMVQENIPLNCFFVNDDVDAASCLEKLKELTNNYTMKKFIVIYGRNIECYCTLNNLLESGVRGSWITLIEPQYEECGKASDIFFEDEEIAAVLEKTIKRSGVKIIAGWDLKTWIVEYRDEENEKEQIGVIKSLRIESKTHKRYVNCDALFYFGNKMIPVKTFLAISKAGLVFDGRLVIDPDFRTNDPYVFAAGSITKYSRKYRDESWQHQYYNSMEIGERLAKRLKQHILHNCPYENNTNVKSSKNVSKDNPDLPVFHDPIIVYCRLPGGLNYLHVRKPGKKVARLIDIARNTYGQVFITGSASSSIGYFRLRLNQFNKIETLTCLRKKDFKVQDLITLYGKHESMLNNLSLRFQNSLISDFFAYFSEPWITALYHDKFDCLRVENRVTLFSKMDTEGNSLIEEIIKACEESDWEELKEEYRRLIESTFLDCSYQESISRNLINFLRDEKKLLPMFCDPDKLRRHSQED